MAHGARVKGENHGGLGRLLDVPKATRPGGAGVSSLGLRAVSGAPAMGAATDVVFTGL